MLEGIKIEEEFRRKFDDFKNRPICNPIEATAKFLQMYVLDNYISEAEEEIAEFAKNYPEEAKKDLVALKMVILDQTLKDGVLTELVEEEGGKPLNEPKDDEARVFWKS
jgi:hypothetical protein